MNHPASTVKGSKGSFDLPSLPANEAHSSDMLQPLQSASVNTPSGSSVSLQPQFTREGLEKVSFITSQWKSKRWVRGEEKSLYIIMAQDLSWRDKEDPR